MKRFITLISIISCFSVMLLSCASIITHKDTNEQISTTDMTTPIISTVTTMVTTPSWSIQTGSHVVNSHSGYVIPIIKSSNTLISAKILEPTVFFYDNESLQLTVNANLLTVYNEIEYKVNAICNRYSDSDPSLFLSTPNVFVDYSLEYFTKEAMSLKFQIIETDNNANTYKSFLCYSLDLTTGSIINSSAVFAQSDLGAISQFVFQKLSENGYTLYDNSSKLIEQYFQNRWFMSFEKLNLVFNPGEIAAASEGIIEISIEINEISDLLSQYGSGLFAVSYENN